MGRAVTCPMCGRADVRAGRLVFTVDILSSVPFTTVEKMLVLSCRNCRHVHLVRPSEQSLADRRLVMN